VHDWNDTFDSVIGVVSRLRERLRKGTNRQVRSADERMLVKAACQAWYQSHKPALTGIASQPLFKEADAAFASLLEYSDQNTVRSKYIDLLAGLKAKLIKLRSTNFLAAPTTLPQQPDFKRLINDPIMLGILERRWAETLACIGAGAHLAATVMMGGLLEALCLARVNGVRDLKPVFTAAAAPKDKAGRARPLKEWGLKNYLDVANELGWIRQSAKDVGVVLRDYRNYVHPEKERTHGVSINAEDSRMFLAVLSSLAGQIIASAGP
jgi:hypothetical protein